MFNTQYSNLIFLYVLTLFERRVLLIPNYFVALGMSQDAGCNQHNVCYANTLEYSVLNMKPLDLHVLGTPPAFVLSQDQTLKLIFEKFN